MHVSIELALRGEAKMLLETRKGETTCTIMYDEQLDYERQKSAKCPSTLCTKLKSLLTFSIGVVRRPHAKNSRKMTTTAWLTLARPRLFCKES